MTFPLSSIYHATKFALEGWSESMSYELTKFGIAIKTVAPGAILTDFSGRSADLNSHPEYEEIEKKLSSTTEAMMQNACTAEQIAKVVYQAVTDGKNQVRYIAGADANAIYAQQLENGADAFRTQISKQFL